MKNLKWLLTAACMILMLAACAAEPTPETTAAPTTEPVQQVQTQPTETVMETVIETQPEEPRKEVLVSTIYGDVVLGGHWEGTLRAEVVQEDVCCIRTYGQIGAHEELPLFEVAFGGEGELMGYVRSADGTYASVCIRLEELVPDGTWTETEIQEYYGMQNEVNSILDQLDLISEEEALPDNGETVQVHAGPVTLTYPAKWASQLRPEVSGDTVITVSFFGTPSGAEECHLFDVILGGETEAALGICTGSDGAAICVEIANVSETMNESWTETQKLEFSAMIEVINDILDGLVQSGTFTYL